VKLIKKITTCSKITHTFVVLHSSYMLNITHTPCYLFLVLSLLQETFNFLYILPKIAYSFLYIIPKNRFFYMMWVRTLTSDTGAILLRVEILLGRLRLRLVQLWALRRRGTGTGGARGHQNGGGANQTHGRPGAGSSHQQGARVIEEGRDDLQHTVFYTIWISFLYRG